jgi:FAD synthase
VHFWRTVNRRLRGRLLEVEFVRRLRPDRRFKKTQGLIDQMRSDVRLAKKILKMFS